MLTTTLLALALFAQPQPPSLPPKQNVRPRFEKPAEPKLPPAQDAAKSDGKQDEEAKRAPAVKEAVEKMQAFYDSASDFGANFHQRYTYKSVGRTTEAKGTVRFLKAGSSMRWDYLDKAGKVTRSFVVAKNQMLIDDRAAKQFTIAGLDADRLSASVTFLWGKGRLLREFEIARAERADLAGEEGAIALELTPKRPDPKYQRLFFLVDGATYAVKSTIVVDPDGSENRIDFTDVKPNQGLKPDLFDLKPPPDAQVVRIPS